MGERHSRSSDDGVFHFVSKLRRVGDVRGVRPGVFASEAKGESREEEEYEEKKKKKKKNKEEEDVVVPRMSAYGVIVLETIADRLETIASIASGRDPLALRVACFACAWLFVLSFFVSFSAWFAALALFATKPKGAKRVLEACFR